uniref:Transmembrane serine protease 15 n=1 Tax=Erpetoichthys calabaricus TaxID=27687 RepID=A0A8C4RPL0_ERPCA
MLSLKLFINSFQYIQNSEIMIKCVNIQLENLIKKNLFRLEQNESNGTSEHRKGRFIIQKGAIFSENLLNKSSMDFKSLAFDVEHMVCVSNLHMYLFFLASCFPDFVLCGNKISCVNKTLLCDGQNDCPDGSDEAPDSCATPCDGQFILEGPAGFFNSKNFPSQYEQNLQCQWIIWYFYQFFFPKCTIYYGWRSKLHNLILTNINFYDKMLIKVFLTVLYEEKINCSFEEGMCYWTQDLKNNGQWTRLNRGIFPPFSGPEFDHTFGNSTGFYIATNQEPGIMSYNLLSLALRTANHPQCLSFWYHMYGSDVYRLSVLLDSISGTTNTIFEKTGNYGDHWNYAQITLNEKYYFARMGRWNIIALDDIKLTNTSCVGVVPEPTHVPQPTIPPSEPTDCGGPFELWESNNTFSSPNYPNNYVNRAFCTWHLNAEEGKNIQFHFSDFELEYINDVVEVRDGRGDESLCLVNVFTGKESFRDVYSTTNHMTVHFVTNKEITRKGFLANFTTGYHLGFPCKTLGHKNHST